MTDLRIEAVRGDLVESAHRVSVAVVHADGRLVASAGDPARVAFWRSAAKPFQALPLVDDGVADAVGLTPAELALACASHSSEPAHLAVVDAMLRRIGVGPDDLACGPHQPLSATVAARVAREGITLTPAWSNCSGKHAGMLALARHHGWPTAGYERAGHQVQRRILAEVSRWTGVPAVTVPTATDGCAAVTFALPLSAMALAWARLGASSDAGPARLRGAMPRIPSSSRGPAGCART
jgi:L-asparaginase II